MTFTMDETKLKDMIWGATILGTGGGGDVEIGKKLINDTIRINPEIQFIDPESLPENEYVAVISGMGSPAATKERGFELEQCLKAFEKLEETTSKKINYVTAFETGGGNFVPPLYVAAKKGLTVVDGDGVGRAVPEIFMSMFGIKELNPSPFAMSDLDNNSAVLFVQDSITCERMGRALVSEMGGVAGVANYLMTTKQAKEILIPKTYSRAEKVGRKIREAKENNEDPIKALLAVEQGIELIRGKISKLELYTKNAHDYGYQIIDGTGNYKGEQYKIDFKNENMIARNNEGNVKVISPDLICVLEINGEPLTNADIKEGMEVACIGISSDPKWKEQEAYDVFKDVLETMDYQDNYIPIEKLHNL